jgi:hypothetical protein
MEKYDKTTYIGYLKKQNGGIKIIPGNKDDKIVSNRDKVLSHLTSVLSGGVKLKEKNVVKYFKALEGKYIRDKMENINNPSGGSKELYKDAHKLIKLSIKKDLPLETTLNIFKGSGPELYKKLESKIGGDKIIRKESYRSGGSFNSRESSFNSRNSRGGFENNYRFSEGGRRYSKGGRRYSEGGGRYSEGGRRYSEGGGRYSEGGRRYSEGGYPDRGGAVSGLCMNALKESLDGDIPDATDISLFFKSGYLDGKCKLDDANLRNLILKEYNIDTKTLLGGYEDNYRYSEGGRRYSEGGRRYSEGGNRDDRYNSIGGEKLTSSMFKDINTNVPGFSYHDYFVDKDNKDKRNAIIEEYEKSTGVPSINDAIVYIGAIEGLYNRNVLCDLGNRDDCNKKKAKAIQMGRRLYKELSKTYPNNNIDMIFNDEGYNIFDYIKKHSFGGYESEGGYPDRGGAVSGLCMNDLEKFLSLDDTVTPDAIDFSTFFKTHSEKYQCRIDDVNLRKLILEKYNFDTKTLPLKKGGYEDNYRYSEGGGRYSEGGRRYSEGGRRYSDYNMRGGALKLLRDDLNLNHRNLFDIELNKLRQEIALIRG